MRRKQKLDEKISMGKKRKEEKDKNMAEGEERWWRMEKPYYSKDIVKTTLKESFLKNDKDI